jgi:hypothetical protein
MRSTLKSSGTPGSISDSQRNGASMHWILTALAVLFLLALLVGCAASQACYAPVDGEGGQRVQVTPGDPRGESLRLSRAQSARWRKGRSAIAQ